MPMSLSGLWLLKRKLCRCSNTLSLTLTEVTLALIAVGALAATGAAGLAVMIVVLVVAVARRCLTDAVTAVQVVALDVVKAHLHLNQTHDLLRECSLEDGLLYNHQQLLVKSSGETLSTQSAIDLLVTLSFGL